MDDDQQKQSAAKESLDSSLEYDPKNPPAPPAAASSDPSISVESRTKKAMANISKRWSIFVPLFIGLLIGLIVVAFLVFRHFNSHPTSLAQQTLSPSQLSNLANSNQVVGNSNQVLTVQSSSIFNGQVLIKGQLQVAGQLKVGSNLDLTDLSVAGSGQIGQLQVNQTLAVVGKATIQGGLVVQNNLSVSGTAAFSGNVTAPQITTNSLQLSGDLTLNHHLKTGGSVPSQTTGSAVGSGGTSSVNGSDTAGTLTINTGSGPSAGCYITVNFATAFASTPSVLITPVGSGAAALGYYVNRSTTSFSVCGINSPGSGQGYIFDYLVID